MVNVLQYFITCGDKIICLSLNYTKYGPIVLCWYVFEL